MYGIHKAVEELAKALGTKGWEKIGSLDGHDRAYVDEVRETAQTARHYSGYKARKLLTDVECRERATALINAYAGTVPI